jgi:D-alanine-D-alanine ligase
MATNTRPELRVLHLAGSRVSAFYHDLSLLYAKDAVRPDEVHSTFAIVQPDGSWRLGDSPDALSEPMALPEALARLTRCDVVVPHMFCLPGMTSYRALFEDLMGVPLVGSPARCTALAADKALTRSVAVEAGVRVAKGEVIRRGDPITLPPPFVVKPVSEDNSLGLSLVRHPGEIDTALGTGFEHGDRLLVEQYIPGRELRVAVIERNGSLHVPPMIEYLVSEEHPIRTVSDKLRLGADGNPTSQPDRPAATPVCPAELPRQLFAALAHAATRAHRALGCRDYSLFDFRVHAQSDQPYLLEAGLFWSFSPISMISRMLLADGADLEQTTLTLGRQAARRRRVADRSSPAIDTLA